MGERPPKLTDDDMRLVLCLMLMLFVLMLLAVMGLAAFGVFLYVAFGAIPAACYVLFILIVFVCIRLAGE